MFCINCGTKLPEGAKFCLECGTKVPLTPAEAENARTAETPAEAESARTAEKPAEAESAQTAEKPTEAESIQTTKKQAEAESAQSTKTPAKAAGGKAAGRKSASWLWMPLAGIALGVVIILLMDLKPELFTALSPDRADSSGKRRERSENYEEYAEESNNEGDDMQASKPESSQEAGEPLTEEPDAAGDGVTDGEAADGYEGNEAGYDYGGGEIDLALGVIEKTAYLVDDSYHQLLQLEPDRTFTLTVNLLEGMGQVYGTYEYFEDGHYEFYVDGRDFRGFQGDDVWGFEMKPGSSSCLVYTVDYYYIGMVSPGMEFYLRDTPSEASDWWDSNGDNSVNAMQYGDLDLLDYLGEYSGWSNGDEIMVDIWWRDEESVNVSILWFQGSDVRRKHTFFTKPTNLGGNVLRFVMGDDEWHKLEIIPGYASESGYPTIFLDGDASWPIVMVDVDNQPT